METLIILILIAFVVISIAFISASNSKKTTYISTAQSTHTTTPQHTQRKNKELKDFFNIDIHNIYNYRFIYDGVVQLPKDMIYIDGIIPPSKFKHMLNTPELGCLDKVELSCLKRNTDSIEIEREECPTITFYGLSNAQLNSQIFEFVNWCFAQYGYDDLEQGGISPENMAMEFAYVERGIFSRVWEKVWLHIEDGKFVLVLYDVPQENKPIV